MRNMSIVKRVVIAPFICLGWLAVIAWTAAVQAGTTHFGVGAALLMWLAALALTAVTLIPSALGRRPPAHGRSAQR